MRSAPRVTLLRSDNRIVVSPTPPELRRQLEDRLIYVEREQFGPAETRRRVDMGLAPVEIVPWQCFIDDHRGRIATSIGFREAITEILKAGGYEVVTRWANQDEYAAYLQRRDTVYKPQWDRIREYIQSTGFRFRYRQAECLRTMAQFEYGRIDCPPGWGKGTMIGLYCMLYPRAMIDVVTKSVDVLHRRLYPELAMLLPSVGLVGGGSRRTGRRVLCITADSLAHCRPEADIVLVDEGHQACADRFSDNLGNYRRARFWMFSASWDMRIDGKDMRAEAAAGPIRFSMPYEEAMRAGVVVPLEVHWSNVVMDLNPAGGVSTTDKVLRKKLGFWTNDYRNSVIAQDARRYDADTQTLITTETIEHAMHLKKHLPEFTLVYAAPANRYEFDCDLARYRALGLVDDRFVTMTHERRTALTRAFEQNRLRKVIATTVWNVGVDFRHLQVLIRADGGASPINDTQIPGRASRINAVGKNVGIVHDYLDQFDTGFHQRATGRRQRYGEQGWTQYNPDGSVWSASAKRAPKRGTKQPKTNKPDLERNLFSEPL